MLTLIIVIATTAISLYALYQDESLMDRFILTPYYTARNKEYYRLITSGFIHADLFHLFFNMYALYAFGRILEMFGIITFLLIYFGSIFAGSYISFINNRGNLHYSTLGASGGVSGVLFATILYYPSMSVGLLFIPIPIPGPVFALLYLAYSHYASKNAQDNVNHDAHIWGAITGFVLAALFRPVAVLSIVSEIKGYFLN